MDGISFSVPMSPLDRGQAAHRSNSFPMTKPSNAGDVSSWARVGPRLPAQSEMIPWDPRQAAAKPLGARTVDFSHDSFTKAHWSLGSSLLGSPNSFRERKSGEASLSTEVSPELPGEVAMRPREHAKKDKGVLASPITRAKKSPTMTVREGVTANAQPYWQAGLRRSPRSSSRSITARGEGSGAAAPWAMRAPARNPPPALPGPSVSYETGGSDRCYDVTDPSCPTPARIRRGSS